MIDNVMRKLKYFNVLWIAIPFFFSDCHRGSSDPGINTVWVQADVLADDAFNEVDGIIESSLSFYSIGARKEESEDSLIMCAEKSLDPDTRTITIDFGDGCRGLAGRIRKGKIIIRYSSGLFVPGASVVTTFRNFYINDIRIEGKRILTNITAPADTLIKFHVVVTGGKLTWPDSTSITRESDLIQTWNLGDTPMEDEITVDGVANGTTINGSSYVMNISSPLLYKRVCWIFRIFIPISGMKQLESNGNTMVINYGDGVCDREVSVWSNGVSKTVEVSEGM